MENNYWGRYFTQQQSQLHLTHWTAGIDPFLQSGSDLLSKLLPANFTCASICHCFGFMLYKSMQIQYFMLNLHG